MRAWMCAHVWCVRCVTSALVQIDSGTSFVAVPEQLLPVRKFLQKYYGTLRSALLVHNFE